MSDNIEEYEDEDGNIVTTKQTKTTGPIPNVNSNNKNAHTTQANEGNKSTQPSGNGSSTENTVFPYGGKWAYISKNDNQLYIFNADTNTWEREQQDAISLYQQSMANYDNLNKNNQNNNSNNNNKNKKNNKNNKRKKTKEHQEQEKIPELKEEDIVDLVVDGIPLDCKLVTRDDLYQVFRRVGYIQENDDEDSSPKIVFLVNQDGSRTGQAIISFARKESIPLAIQMLDDTEICKGYKMKLQKATLEQVNSLNGPNNQPKKKQKEDIRKEKKNEMKYGWGDSESRVVVLKNLFEPKESWTKPTFFDEIKEDLEQGCERCGEVQSITIFERNPEGVATIKFKEYESAEKCVALMNERFFAGRQLEAFLYDGFTDYHVEETEQERSERLKVWEQYLKDEEDNSNNNREKEEQEEDVETD